MGDSVKGSLTSAFNSSKSSLHCPLSFSNHSLLPPPRFKDVPFPFPSASSWSTPETCTAYSLLLSPGLYQLEAWGGIGGFQIPQLKSEGGYVKAELTLDEETPIFVVAGGNGESSNTPNSVAKGGCNYGGDGYTFTGSIDFFSGGGGSSHVAVLQNKLSHRILVAGGSGGSHYVSSSYQAKGGEGGGEIGNNGHQWKDYDDGVGKGATQTTPGQGCVRGSGCFDGKFGDGGSNSGSVYGCGGGGGWFGGASSLYGSRAAGGGSGFVFEGKTGTGCSEIDNHPLIGKIKPLKIVTSQVGGS